MSEPNTNALSSSISAIFDAIKGRGGAFSPAGENETVIAVNSLTSTAGAFYEKFRYLLDYKDEHSIKRSAVARILKRQLMIERVTDVGLQLLQELITGGYLPNKTVPESVAASVQAIVNPYIALRERVQGIPGSDTMIVGFAASEVSRFLFPTAIEEAVLSAYYGDVRERVKVNFDITPEEFDQSVYVACRRGLLREDNDLLAYALWLRFSKWGSAMQGEDIGMLAQHFAVIQQRIKQALKFQLGWDMVPRLKNCSIYYSVLWQMIEQYGMEAQTVLQDENNFERAARSILTEHYKRENTKTVRSAIRAIFYIFCTKLILAFLLEIPYEYYYLKDIHYLPLASNVIFHPVLLFLITRIVPLGERNTLLVLSGIRKTVSGEDRKLIKVKRSGSGALDTFFAFLYLFLFLVSFGILVFLLVKLQFSIVGILLFLFFLTLVSYFGLRIRHNALRWRVKTDDEGLLPMLWGVFTLPIVRAGRWLSRTFAAINIFVFFLDFIIEAPFKLLLSISDAFTTFLREKRDETF